MRYASFCSTSSSTDFYYGWQTWLDILSQQPHVNVVSGYAHKIAPNNIVIMFL